MQKNMFVLDVYPQSNNERSHSQPGGAHDQDEGRGRSHGVELAPHLAVRFVA